MVERGRLLAGVALVAVVMALAGCSGPASKSEVVCDDCVDAIEHTAEETNRSIRVTESVTQMRLCSDGNGRVVARMTVEGSDVSALRTNETLLERIRTGIAADAVERSDQLEDENSETTVPADGDDGTRPAFQRQNLTASLEGKQFVVRYMAVDVVDNHVGGTTLSNTFFREGERERADEDDADAPIRIATDRLVVRGPDGSQPLIDPPGASTDGDRVIWTSEEISTRSYLAFGDANPVGRAAARAALVGDVFAWSGLSVLFIAAIPTLLLAPGAGWMAVAYTRRVERDDWRLQTDSTMWFVGGTILTVGALFAGVFGGSPISVVLGGLGGFALFVLAWLVVNSTSAESGGTEAATVRQHPSDGSEAPVSSGRHDGLQGVDLRSRETGPESSADTADGEQAADAWSERIRSRQRGWRDRIQSLEPSTWHTAIDRREVAAVACVLLATLLVSVTVANDVVQTEIAGAIVYGSALLPVLAMGALGHLVTDPTRSAARAAVVTAVAVSPSLVAGAILVDHGSDMLLLVLIATFFWGICRVVIGYLAFYLVLGLSIQRQSAA